MKHTLNKQLKLIVFEVYRIVKMKFEYKIFHREKKLMHLRITERTINEMRSTYFDPQFEMKILANKMKTKTKKNPLRKICFF